MSMFSVVIPVYTPYKDLLADAINSVLSQTYTDFELLLICGDHLCDDVIPSDPRIVLIYIDKDNVSAKRNAGISRFRGDYLLFLDADDCLHVDILRYLQKQINETNSDVVCFGFSRESHDFQNPLVDGQIFTVEGRDNVVRLCFKNMLNSANDDLTLFDSSWGKAWSRDLLFRSGCLFVDPPCRGEDALFSRQLYLTANSISISPEAIGYYWRRNARSVTQSGTPDWLNLNTYLEHARKIVCQTPYYSDQAFFDYGSGLFYLDIRLWLGKRKNKSIGWRTIQKNIKKTYTGRGTLLYECIHKTNRDCLTLKLAKHRTLLILCAPFLHWFVR